MKLYEIDRKIQIRHFSDLSILEGRASTNSLSLFISAQEDFVLQLAALPEGEKKIVGISAEGDETITCINTQITDKFGRSYEKEVPLQEGEIQPLFFLLPVSGNKPGSQKNIRLTIYTDLGEVSLSIKISYTDEPVENRGDNELWRLSRLHWLNSSRFLDNHPVAPYPVPKVDGRRIKILGRDIWIGENGLPEQAVSYFDEGIYLKEEEQRRLLASPMRFSVAGEEIIYDAPVLKQEDGRVDISACGSSEHFRVNVEGILRYEGSVDYLLTLTALSDIQTEDISLQATLSPDCADYMIGLGAVGGPAHDLTFYWTAEKHLDCLFVGAVNAGLRIKWKAEDYTKPLVNIYYRNQPLNVPETTWDNHQAGRIIFQNRKNASVIMSNTGLFSMKKGESRLFRFEIHFTPFKAIDYQKHYSVRYSHNDHLENGREEVERAARNGLNYIIVHHGNRFHPFINYPFIETQELKSLVEEARKKNIGVLVYYTVREHSNHMAEVFAYKALGDEIILRKRGKGFPWKDGPAKWLTKYFGEEIIPAWKVEYQEGKYKDDPDISFLVRPNSRLDNYYIEGLDWLVKNIGIQGIYIDDTALDRTTIERAKKVLAQANGLINMHMWNHETDCAGDVSCMSLYTELFPFLDNLWIGEGYRYRKLSPEYLLMEVSGIPYGQTSQMLQDGGDPYIGMLYAMNNRFGWGVENAGRIYSLWDRFEIEKAEMRGYWHSKNPVSTGCGDVKATVYLKEKAALVCMFNFSEESASFSLKVHREKLGFSPNGMKEVWIEGLQEEKRMGLSDKITLGPQEGRILLLEE